jgi:hypothetical protein
MRTPRPKHHSTLAAALKAADDKRRDSLAWLFGVPKPEPEEPPEVVADDVGTGWGTGATGGTPPDTHSLDERLDLWLRDTYRRNHR